jgi:mannose-1-phosphate guanylyltransferase
MLHAVIMAGGTGTRFWPQSTESKPKQFLNIFGDRTMLQATVDRISPLIPSENVWVITNDRYVDLVQEQLPDVPTQNIVGEAVAKNTGPCVAAAAALVQQKDPDGTMVVLPADHVITQPGAFLSILETAESKAADGKSLVTIGIKPNHPETGYGYIEFDTNETETHDKHEVKKVKQFREKPDIQTAQEFLDSGNFLWNSGMFVWQASTILNQFQEHLPSVYSEVEKLQPSIGGDNQKEAIDTFYHGCPNISVDYGIMEQAQTVHVVPGSFGWNDVGSWRAVYELRDKDSNGNVVQTDTVEFARATNNLVKSDSGKMIALVGVDELAVVETETAILVCKLDESQGVKEVVNRLRKDEDLKRFV